MLTRTIPSSGAPLPVIGLGTYKGFDVSLRDKGRAALGGVLGTLLAAGSSVIDSSPMYGRAEGVLGELIAAQRARERAFIATKVWTEGRASGIEQMNRSMNLLRCERVDLMQIHNLVVGERIWRRFAHGGKPAAFGISASRTILQAPTPRWKRSCAARRSILCN
jgi:diketogulonate reductase-like aldo/keto reductase